MIAEVRLTQLPLDPLRLARRLQHRPGFALLTGEWGETFLTCSPLRVSRELDPEPTLALGSGGPLAAVPRWIGVVPYECRRGLERQGGAPRDQRPLPHVTSPWWLRYGAVARIDPTSVAVLGDDAAAIRDLARSLCEPCDDQPLPAALEFNEALEADAVHVARIERALELIAAGELYQVNLARRFRMRARGRAVDIFEKMASKTQRSYGAVLELSDARVVSTSPELFLELTSQGEVITQPIKGTRPTFGDAAADLEMHRQLETDAKEHAELTMVLDVERNDLGRVCHAGSVRLVEGPLVRRYGTVHHRLATLSGRLRGEVSRRALLEATSPSGSVTGAPKVRAMDAIASLEAHRRGLYTGSYGVVFHDGSLKLAMAIRCLTIVGDEAHYHSGGGIVADSDPLREVEETRWKALQLTALGADTSV
jgi:anthranilate/para-aminobenzoate synthase component I